ESWEFQFPSWCSSWAQSARCDSCSSFDILDHMCAQRLAICAWKGYTPALPIARNTNWRESCCKDFLSIRSGGADAQVEAAFTQLCHPHAHKKLVFRPEGTAKIQLKATAGCIHIKPACELPISRCGQVGVEKIHRAQHVVDELAGVDHTRWIAVCPTHTASQDKGLAGDHAFIAVNHIQSSAGVVPVIAPAEDKSA